VSLTTFWPLWRKWYSRRDIIKVESLLSEWTLAFQRSMGLLIYKKQGKYLLIYFIEGTKAGCREITFRVFLQSIEITLWLNVFLMLQLYHPILINWFINILQSDKNILSCQEACIYFCFFAKVVCTQRFFYVFNEEDWNIE